MIDVTTAGDDGHWDHADIKRLCEYRDQLKAALRWIASVPCVGIMSCTALQLIYSHEEPRSPCVTCIARFALETKV
jgi:hypothetical protein